MNNQIGHSRALARASYPSCVTAYPPLPRASYSMNNEASPHFEEVKAGLKYQTQRLENLIAQNTRDLEACQIHLKAIESISAPGAGRGD